MKKEKKLIIPAGAVILTKEECENIYGGVIISNNDSIKNNNKEK